MTMADLEPLETSLSTTNYVWKHFSIGFQNSSAKIKEEII